MYGKSPSRNNRSKSGIKLKHILQVCLLVAVCFWLIYQVKRSHEKKKEFDEKDGGLAIGTQADGEMLRLGRKDVPRIIADDKLHGEEEEDAEIEEDNKHEEDENEREVSKTEGREEEEEELSEGNDEIDEHKQDKTDAESEHEEELDEEHEAGIEEKENEEGDEKENDDEKENEDEGEEKGEESEEGGKVEESEEGEKEDNHQDNERELQNQDHDGGDESGHEAREEHYKADDASSEVAHEVETFSLEHPKETLESKNSEQENSTQNGDQTLLEEKPAQVHEGNVTEGLSNSTSIDELKDKDNLRKLEDSSVQNTTLSESNDQKLLENNLAADKSQNSSALPSGTQIPSNLTQAEVATVVSKPSEDLSNSDIEMPKDTSHLASNETLLEGTTILNTTEHANDTNRDSLSSSEESKSVVSEKTGDSQDSREDFIVNNNSENGTADESQVVKPREKEFESFDSHSENENVGFDQHDDPIDDSDSSIMREEAESRTDLDTLPGIQSEVQSTEEAEAE